MKRFFPNLIRKILFLSVFLCLLVTIIAYARGYRYDAQNKLVTSTGIVAVSAFPRAAKVYVNGTLKGVTDLTVTLPPGRYHIDVKKEGYTSWSKDLTLKGELVLTLDVLLYPLNPALSPLTNIGVKKAIPIDQTNKVVLFAETGDELKDGIYLFEYNKGPLSFLAPLKLLMLKSALPFGADMTQADMVFSPDYKQAILEIGSVSYLLSLEGENTNQFDITVSKDSLIEAWNEKKRENELKILQTFDPDFTKIASDSFHIIAFSPDESKILYNVTEPTTIPPIITPAQISTNQTPELRSLSPSFIYVYDRKEDKNYVLSIPDAANILKSDQILNFIGWYPDSKHIAFMEKTENRGKIRMVDYDGTNEQTVYAGPFIPSFFKASSDGGIIVMTNFNSDVSDLSDLYSVGIK